MVRKGISHVKINIIYECGKCGCEDEPPCVFIMATEKNKRQALFPQWCPVQEDTEHTTPDRTAEWVKLAQERNGGR